MRIGVIYRDGLPAIITSILCSICTTIISQLLLFMQRDVLNPATQTIFSVLIFVVAYWIVYFALRRRLAVFMHGSSFRAFYSIEMVSRGHVSSKNLLVGKVIFVIASEVFWIISLGIGNYLLLAHGVSAGRAAFIAQWGINLTIWLPLLPLWEELAVYKVPLFLLRWVRALQ